jgi:DNA-binding response OmpR family regulator
VESKASKANILVVEDEATIRELLEAMLEPQDYVVRTAADGQEGLRTFFSWKADLVFLDVMIPKMDGWKLLERIREVSDVSIIMLTALGMEHEKVRGLKGGADDYLTKPISQGELLARVEAVLRRNKKTTFVESYHDSLLLVDFERHVVLKSGQEVDLSPP